MKELLSQLLTNQPLSRDQAEAGFETIMTGQADPAQTGAFLALMQTRGPVVDEVVAGATVMRRHLVPVRVPEGLTIIDTCGTGGTHSTFFNISTSAAIVAAAAGRPKGLAVAKHGNKSVTSASGSANVLGELGVTVPAAPEVLTQCLDEIGICFCFAPAHHPAMKHAGPVRQALGFRTIFNLLGPLTNPAGARRQLLGVPNVQIAQLMIAALKQLDAEEAMVVTTTLPDGKTLGEMTNCAPTTLEHLKAGRIDQSELDAAALGMPLALPESVSVATPAESAAVIRGVFAGESGPARDIVLLNTAAALRVGGLTDDWAEGVALAAEALDSGAAAKTLETLVKLTAGA